MEFTREQIEFFECAVRLGFNYAIKTSFGVIKIGKKEYSKRNNMWESWNNESFSIFNNDDDKKIFDFLKFEDEKPFDMNKALREYQENKSEELLPFEPEKYKKAFDRFPNEQEKIVKEGLLISAEKVILKETTKEINRIKKRLDKYLLDENDELAKQEKYIMANLDGAKIAGVPPEVLEKNSMCDVTKIQLENSNDPVIRAIARGEDITFDMLHYYEKEK